MEQKFAVIGDFATVITGAGAPGATTGSVGDMYIDTTAWNIYGPKAAGGWGTAQSLIGPPGLEGSYTVVTTIGATGADDKLPSEQAVREALAETTDNQVALDIAQGVATVGTSGAVGGTWTLSEGAADNIQILTRTAAAADHYYRIPIPLPKRLADGKGAKLQSVTVSYVAGGTLDTANDIIQAQILKQTVPTNGNAATAAVLAGDDDVDYDADHNSNAERVEAGNQTMTVTIPVGEQAYAADNETYALRVRVKDAATANLTFVLTGAVANFAATVL